MSRSDTKPVTFIVSAAQLEWIEARAKRLGVEAGGAHIGRSAVVRRAIDEARERDEAGQPDDVARKVG